MIDTENVRLFLAFRIFFSSLDTRKGPYRGWEVFPGTFLRPITYPANFPGLGEALIFFCFFSCIKTRKEDYSRIQKRVGRQAVGAYCIQ